MKTIPRDDYLGTLRDLRDKQLIKVITGVRRCGKSTLLDLFRDELLASGVGAKLVTKINFEEPENSFNRSWHDIYADITKRLIANKINYVFLDEVQYIADFERLLVGLQTKPNVDLYVTGSNAQMLSSELATLLTGRSYEINMLPLSFREYLSAFDDATQPVTREQRFNDYLNYGGFPQATEIFLTNPSLVDDYLEGVYNTIVNRDILSRKKAADQSTLDNVSRYLLENIGNFSSPTKIANVLNASHHTMANYISALTDSFLLYPVKRLHIKGKQQLRSQDKYYAVDLGLRSMLLGREAEADVGHMLENIVFLELRRRGSDVWIGKTGDKEVDFVVQDTQGYTEYYQVAWSVRDSTTLERELAPLRSIKDHSTKFLITMDDEEPAYDGIRQTNAINWLVNR